MDKLLTFTVNREDESSRLDQFLAGRAPELTRSRIKSLADEGLAIVNGAPAKAGLRLKASDIVELTVPDRAAGLPEPEDIALDILYEDDDIIVVNKGAGIAVHPGAGRSTGTLVSALLWRTRLASIGSPLRPGIVHRLDKDTTGAMVVAKNDRSYLSLASQFKERSSSRKYLALAWGSTMADEGSINMPIGRDSSERKKISTRGRHTKAARTGYRVVRRLPLMTLLELTLDTGRTHQIRVHLTAINHPVVGDQVYGKRPVPPALPKAAADILKGIKRQMLHAWTLGITHPASGERLEFTAPLPHDMDALISALSDASTGA